jgi:thiol-disulfide isomerase/thioredoxin
MKRTIGILLAVLMLTALMGTAYADSSGLGIEPGQAFPDFTVSLTDGTTATLSELLKEKDLVVLNVFASWCGPCEMEFPEMEKSYQAHSDRMVILSVSGDPSDTMEMIADYKASHGLSFPMGLAGDALGFLKVSAFPTTVFIAKDGKVGFIKVGAFTSGEDFEDKVGTFLSDNYNGLPLPSEVAHSYTLQIMAGILVTCLLLVIGRWRLLRKAGKPGWHSLIPLLSTYQEYDLCWKGWIGILALLLPAAGGVIGKLAGQANWSVLLTGACSIG